MASTANALGDYLRARREQIRPEDVGLIGGARRRVPGLRREELALLAGISSDYYVRLEQGRDKHPSPEVINALAGALKLDVKATEYLHQLAAPRAARTPLRNSEAVPDGAEELIDQFPMPAIIANRYLDVLAANPLAHVLSPSFTPGRNLLRWQLRDPARSQFVNWDETTDVLVSGLREAADGRSRRSTVAFANRRIIRIQQLFQNAVGSCGRRIPRRVIHIRHPGVGDMYLHPNRFNIPHSGGQHLLTFRADPGTESAQALEKLHSPGSGTLAPPQALS